MSPGEINLESNAGTEQVREPIDWFQMPYPAWLRAWLGDETTRLRNSGRFNTTAAAKAEAKKLIDSAYAEHGVPSEYQDIKEPEQPHIPSGVGQLESPEEPQAISSESDTQ